MSDYFRPLTKHMKDALVSLLRVSGGRPSQQMMVALERRELVCNGELTIIGHAAAIEINRTRARARAWGE